MTKDEILEKIQNVVRDQLDDDQVELKMDTVANSVEGWDSLSHIRIIIAVEEEFGVEFNTSDVISLHNLGDLVNLVEARLAA
jgi:acyl carrier protein